MMLNLKQLVAITLPLAVVACGDQVETPPAEIEQEGTAPLVEYRFDMVSSDPIEHGERLSAVLGCIGCHKLDLTGEDWSDPEYGTLWTANLTQSAHAFSESELIAMIAEGVRPDRALIDMPSYLFSELHADDLAALVSHFKSLSATGETHPEPTIGPQLAKEIANGEFKDSEQAVAEMRDQAPPDAGPEHAFARFIVRATCAECHGMDLRGGTEPMMDAPPPPPLRIVGAYSPEDFSTLMKTGKALGGRKLKVMGGVSRGRYSRFTEKELTAVYDYLKELAQRDL